MKRLIVLLFAVAIVAASFGTASALITGSAHDFSSATWNGGAGQEICNVCHTPHGADTSISSAPLWNHEVTSATFTMYSGFDIQGVIATEPLGVSKLCLSCHDGTVSLENYGGVTTGTAFVSSVNAAAEIGTDLSESHPISITYDTSDTEINATSDSMGSSGTTIADVLQSGKVECSSCHDVHDGTEAEGSKLLRVDNSGSGLCLTCHAK